MRIVQISDTHFGTQDPPVVRALLAELQRAPPDLIVLTGDITQRARRGEFRAAAEFVAAFPKVATLVIPGNHDIPLYDVFTRALNPYRLFRRHMGSQLEPEYVHDGVALLCVDATRRTRHKNGVLTRARIDAVAARLRALPGTFRIVATHQPLAVPEAHDIKNVARGATRALASWITAGADLFIGGHIHLPYSLQVASPGARTAVLLQAGTAVSTRRRGGLPNSFNEITLSLPDGGRQMQLQRFDYDAGRDAFVAHSRRLAVDAPGGWRLPAAA